VIASLIFVWLMVIALCWLVLQRKGVTGLKRAGMDAYGTFRSLLIRLPCALLAASFLTQIIPIDMVSNLIGPDSGAKGIVIAAAAGGFLPGGPMASFPIAVVFQQAGAGLPQLVALISGWSIFALHRLLAYEAPIMGWRFAALRSLSCLLIPLAAGFAAEALMSTLRLF
jgi:uncharacterized membrane protein YraQ (UPF0718 family)